MAAYYITNKTEIEERKQKIIEMREKGLTLQSIGKHFCVSAERIRQICGKHSRTYKTKFQLKQESKQSS